jgi:hypothetical protein
MYGRTRFPGIAEQIERGMWRKPKPKCSSKANTGHYPEYAKVNMQGKIMNFLPHFAKHAQGQSLVFILIFLEPSAPPKFPMASGAFDPTFPSSTGGWGVVPTTCPVSPKTHGKEATPACKPGLGRLDRRVSCFATGWHEALWIEVRVGHVNLCLGRARLRRGQGTTQHHGAIEEESVTPIMNHRHCNHANGTKHLVGKLGPRVKDRRKIESSKVNLQIGFKRLHRFTEFD